jgi:predicted alpha/beta hydrolase family esterase
MKKVLLIHGFTGDGNGVWFPWMKKELETRGYEVFTPSLPNSCHPVLQEWVDALEPYYWRLDEEDVIVAHSLGSKASLHTILRVRKKIGRLILVASPIGEYVYRDWEKRIRKRPNEDQHAVQKFWECHLPIEEISNFTKVTLIISNNDMATPLQKFDGIPKDWQKEIWLGLGHFCDKEIPCLLQKVVEK